MVLLLSLFEQWLKLCRTTRMDGMMSSVTWESFREIAHLPSKAGMIRMDCMLG